MEKALKLIISKSPAAMQEAIRTLAAITAHSPIVQQRYNHVVEMALNDPRAEFTTEERTILAEKLSGIETEDRSFTLRIRLTENEHIELQNSTDSAGINLSNYVRRKLFSG